MPEQCSDGEPERQGRVLAPVRQVLAITVASPLTQNIYDRIGAEALGRQYDVVVIDCLEWVREYERKPVFRGIEAPNIVQVDSESAFKAVLQHKAPSFVLDFVGRGRFTRAIQDACREINALYITHLLAPFPNPISRKTVWKSLFTAPVVTMNRIAKYGWRKISQKDPLPPDIALLAGAESDNGWVATAGKKIFTATPGFFELNRVQKQLTDNRETIPGVPSGDFALFIDDCLAMSFDFVLGAQRPIVDSAAYFPMLNDFFARLESDLQIPVVVAAHPNGKEFQGYQGLFGDRTVLFDATAALTLKCRFAMTHYSSAITYPVLLRKPVLLLNSRQLKRQTQGVAINHIAGLLQCPQIDIDRSHDRWGLSRLNLTTVSQSAYAEFERRYISNVDAAGDDCFGPLLRYLAETRPPA